MKNIIFVIYQHGFGGESLSYRLSQHPLCRALTAKITEGRTVITNDVFEKKFLTNHEISNPGITQNEDDCRKIFYQYKNEIIKSKKIIISPSHIKYNTLQKIFDSAKFVIISPPQTTQEINTWKKHLYEDVWCYKTDNVQELLGEIICKIKLSAGGMPQEQLKQKCAKILKNYKNKLTYGQISCLVNDVEPTYNNQKKIFRKLIKDIKFSYFNKNDSNILYVPFKDTKKIKTEEILKYFHIIK